MLLLSKVFYYVSNIIIIKKFGFFSHNIYLMKSKDGNTLKMTLVSKVVGLYCDSEHETLVIRSHKEWNVLPNFNTLLYFT